MPAPDRPTIRCALLLLVLCASRLPAQQAAGWPRAVTDDAGSTLAIPRRPARIVSATLPTDEILLALAGGERLAAVTAFAADPSVSNVAEQAARIPVRLPQLNVEVIISLSPDLVFAASWSDPASVRQLRDAGLTVYIFRSPTSVAEIRRSIARLGAAVGEELKADALVRWMDGRLAAVAGRLSARAPVRQLTVMDYTTWGTSMGGGSSWDEIVRLAGLANAVGGLAADRFGSVPVSKEKLLQIDPDILLLPGWVYGDPSGAERFFSQVVEDPALRGLSAVRQGRILRMPERLKASTSQYIVLAVEELARYAYPAAFQ